MKKDTHKWWEFHKTPTHNMDKCCVKQVLVAELKVSKMGACSNSKPEPDKEKHINDTKPIATVATTKLQKVEPEDPEEGNHLFYSQMWVNCSSV